MSRKEKTGPPRPASPKSNHNSREVASSKSAAPAQAKPPCRRDNRPDQNMIDAGDALPRTETAVGRGLIFLRRG
jgi:hypothetical protein